MSKFRTSRVVELKFCVFHDVTIPKGTPLQEIACGLGPQYAAHPSLVETTSPRGRGTIWAHDTEHFFIFVPADAVESVGV